MRLLKWILLISLILPLLWSTLVLTHWLPRPSADQEAALAMVKEVQARRLGEHNAYPLLWLFKYAVPRDQLNAVMEADLERFEKYIQDPMPQRPFESIALESYAELPEPSKAAAACFGRGGGSCLTDVRANVEAVRAELDAQAERLQRESWLSDYDHIAIAFSRSISAPRVLYFGNGGVVRSAAAFAHLSGDSVRALERLCEHTRSWRRLRQHTDLLQADLLGRSVIAANIRLAAEILAERPDLDGLECLDSFAPLGDEELDQCSTMVGEYLDLARGWLLDEEKQILVQRAVNLRHSRALIAQSKAYYCQAAHQQRILLRAAEPSAPEVRCTFAEQVFNPVGCLLADQQLGDEIYYRGALDLDAKLRTFQAARWLRTHSVDGAPGTALDRLPAMFANASHQLSLSPDGTDLELQQLLQPPGAEPWSIPISRPVADPN
ncbi:MAG: hypothetical protein KDI48_18095 [Xanthomonadales bacterium]|nr:hypothetical protein [Xanthomonadales bacterium]